MITTTTSAFTTKLLAHIRLCATVGTGNRDTTGNNLPLLEPRASHPRAAFSLIEVNMALLVVSLGLAALLGLFPVGLRESSLASADTTEAIFATRVLNALQANAADIKTWSDWEDKDSFTKNIKIGGEVLKVDGKVQTFKKVGGIDKNTIRCLLNLGAVAGTEPPKKSVGRIRYAAIQVADNEHSSVTNNVVYYTEFRYGKN